VSLSQASASELEALDGIGPTLAQRIVDWRDRNGPFGAVEDLLDVPGIGEARLEALRPSVVP
jgi:competence protein ComEA